MYTKLVMTVLTVVMIYICGGFRSVDAGEMDVAHMSSCSASTMTYPCERAIDGNTGSEYASDEEGIGLWFRLDMDQTYHVFRLRIMDRFSLVEKNKGLLLAFSDGSKQTVNFPTPEEGYHWANFPITPVWTHSVIITVISVYSTYNNGFMEIQVYADLDECVLKTASCDVNAGCVNTPGSYTCTCFSGFTGDGVTCTDLDECVLKTASCDVNAGCVNTPGSYTCTCFSGFTGDGLTCTDLDECVLKTASCDVKAGCVNTPGSYTCTCFSGFTGDGLTCTDLDECDLKTDRCDVQAGCVNTPGSYTCTCLSGFTGDGLTCTDLDECALRTHSCDVHARCVNTPGSYTCKCLSGFTGDGITCTDVDECALKTANCDVNAKCVNTPGSYTCTCFPFFKGDGFKCIANSCQVYTVAGKYASPEEQRAAVLMDKSCLKKCANLEGCVASLQHMDTKKCTFYYRESDADKAQYGPGYIMWRAKKP